MPTGARWSTLTKLGGLLQAAADVQLVILALHLAHHGTADHRTAVTWLCLVSRWLSLCTVSRSVGHV